MNKLIDLAIDAAKTKGATAADVRIVLCKNEEIQMRNRTPVHLTSGETQGIGVHLCFDGGWGFACSHQLDQNAIEKVVQRAVEMAKASVSLSNPLLTRTLEAIRRDGWKLPIHQNPFRISLEEKLQLLDDIQEECFQVKGVKTVLGEMGFQEREQYFGNLEGSRIHQKNWLSGCGYAVVAFNGDDVQVRSYPNSFGGQWEASGYELMYQWPLLENARRTAEEAVALLSAPECPSQTCDIILDGSQLALQLHQICGQPAELDRVLGHEANFAGTSFLHPDHQAKLQFGAKLINIFSNPSPRGSNGAGVYAYDDEGVPAQRVDLVQQGVFTDFMTSRNTASAIGANASNGHARASGWNRIPIVRMTNIGLEPGNWELEALIEDTRNGIYLETNKSWSIDARRHNFQFGTEIGWEIKNGKRARMVKNPVYEGATLQFWRSCDAICNKDAWQIWGLSNCGKGQPEQIIATSIGAAPARFRNIQVGSGSHE